MNAAQLQAWFSQNKPAVLGVGAAGVAGLALLSKRRGSSGGSAPAAASPAGVSSPVPASYTAQGSAGASNSAADAYNALQPQLEQILNQTRNVPVPAAPDKFTDGFYRPAGSLNIYRVGDGGASRDWLTYDEAKSLGFSTQNNNGLQVVSSDDSRWKQTTLIGADNTPGAGKITT